MLLMIASAVLGIFAITVMVMLVIRTRSSERVIVRLAALNQEFASASYEETIADVRRNEKKLSTIPWLNQWLTSLNLASSFSRLLYQAGMTVSLGALLMISIGGAAVLGCLLVLPFGTTFAALLPALGFLPLPFLYVRHRRTKRLSTLEGQLPEALGMMVSSLRVGHSLIASLGSVAKESQDPIGGEFRACFDEQNYGIDLRTALVNLTERAPIQDFRIFVAAVLIQKESGGNLAEVLEKVAETTRERFRLKKQVSVHTAQGRLTGWILSILPVALGFAMYLANPESMSVLWTNPTGLKMLYTAGGMDVVGALIIRKIVAIRV
jgi:tight adherence protein B